MMAAKKLVFLTEAVTDHKRKVGQGYLLLPHHM